MRLAYHKNPSWYVRVEALLYECRVKYHINSTGTYLKDIIKTLEEYYRKNGIIFKAQEPQSSKDNGDNERYYIVPFEDAIKLVGIHEVELD